MYNFIKNCQGHELLMPGISKTGYYIWKSIYNLKLGQILINNDKEKVFFNKLFDEEYALACSTSTNDVPNARLKFVQNASTYIVFDIPTNPLTGNKPTKIINNYNVKTQEIIIDEEKYYFVFLGSNDKSRPTSLNRMYNPVVNQNLQKAIKNDIAGQKSLIWQWPTDVDLVIKNTTSEIGGRLFLVITDPIIKISITDCDNEEFIIEYPMGLIEEKEKNILAIEYSSYTYKEYMEITIPIEDININDITSTLGKFSGEFNSLLTEAENGPLDQEYFSVIDFVYNKYEGGAAGIGNDTAIINTLYKYIDDQINFIQNNIVSIAKENKNIDLNDINKKYTVCIESIYNDSETSECVCSSRMDETIGITDSINYLTKKGNLLRGAFIQYTSSRKEMKELREFERERDLKYINLK